MKGASLMRLTKCLAALALGVLFAGVAAAQPPGGRGGFGGGFGGSVVGMLGQNEQLQQELKMDKDQIDKVKAAITKVNEDLKDDVAKSRNFGGPREERDAASKKVSDAMAKAVEAVLKPEQMKRVHQIDNQRAGIAMFKKEDVRKALKLTDAQKEKLDEIDKEYTKDRNELSGGGGGGGGGGGRGGRGGFGGFFDPETRKKLDDLQKDTTAAIKKQLTDDQKTTLKDLTGEPFELRFAFGGAGGGGGFGGGFGGFGGPPQPGKVLTSGVEDQLKLTAEQKKQVEELQKEVDSKLEKILTEEQKKQLKDMQQRGPGRGGPGAPGKPPTRDF
jgi:Spy/CpxP family protein refolding chaperone